MSAESSTSERLVFINTMRITPGHVDAFCEAILQAVDFAHKHAPQLLVDVFIDEEELTATSIQIYADSASVLTHWQLSDSYIAEVMRHCTIDRFEVFGTPSTEVLDGLGRTSGLNAAITPRLVGYIASAAMSTDLSVRDTAMH